MEHYNFSDPNTMDDDAEEFVMDNFPVFHPLLNQTQKNIMVFYKCYYVYVLLEHQSNQQFGLQNISNFDLTMLAERMGRIVFLNYYRPAMGFRMQVPFRNPEDQLPHDLRVMLDESHF